MRKVLFKKWIPRKGLIPIEGTNRMHGTAPGTDCWSDFIHEGTFHQWGSSYEEFESGAGNYSIAIVELPDGAIEEVLPMNLKFIS